MMPITNDSDLFLDPSNIYVSLCLQRGNFADHDSWESLLDGDEHQIVFKQDRLKMPFFQSGTPGGWNIDPNSALTARGLGDLLSKFSIIVKIGGESPSLRSNLPIHYLITIQFCHL